LQITIECYERIARFHILSLHQLALAEKPYDKYDAQQEREQLDKTLLSLMQLYEDSRGRVPAPNEPEFRAYCIIFQIQNPIPDLEDRVQTWPRNIASHSRVQRALRLYAAATNTADSQGPLKPRISQPIAQANWRRFWTLVKSNEISYLMACVSEIYFPLVRKTALNAIWNSCRVGGSRKVEDWTLDELTHVFAFETEHEVKKFCQDYGFDVATRADGASYLDLTSHGASRRLPDATAESQSQRRSDIVEEKRHGRALAAVINGMSVQAAKKAGLMDQSSIVDTSMADDANEKSLFITDHSDDETPVAAMQFNPFQRPAANTPVLNPVASSFNPGRFGAPSEKFKAPSASMSPFKASSMTGFGPSPLSATPQATEPPKSGTFAGSSSNAAGPFDFGKPTSPDTLDTPASLPLSSTPVFGQSPPATVVADPATITTPSSGFPVATLPSFTFGQSASTVLTPATVAALVAPVPSSPFAPHAPKQQPFSGFSAPAPTQSAFTFARPAKPSPPTSTTHNPTATAVPFFDFTASTSTASSAAQPPTDTFQSPFAAGLSTTFAGFPSEPLTPSSDQTLPQANPLAASQTAGFTSPPTFNFVSPKPSTNTLSSQGPTFAPQSHTPVSPSPQELERAAKAKAASQAKNSALLDHVASALVTEKYGLLEQFIEYTAAPMITRARKQVLTERLNKTAGMLVTIKKPDASLTHSRRFSPIHNFTAIRQTMA
jgi:hypothetical protein